MMAHNLIALLDDDRFKQWVASPNPVLDAYWLQFGRDNPGMVATMEKARQIFEVLNEQVVASYPDDAVVEQMLSKIQLLK